MRVSRSILAFATTLGATVAVAQQRFTPPPNVTFEVVDVRKIDTAESLRRSPPDVFGLDVVVRLRLSCSATSVSFLALSSPVVLRPEGHSVTVTESGLTWRSGGPPNVVRRTSPGMNTVCGTVKCDWVVLPAHSTLEWEMLESTAAASERRAFTVFIKETPQSRPREILSSVYDAPLEAGGVR